MVETIQRPFKYSIHSYKFQVTEKSICMVDTSSFKPLLETTPIDYVNLEPEFTYEVPVKIEQYPVKREREAVENKEEKEDVAELTGMK